MHSGIEGNEANRPAKSGRELPDIATNLIMPKLTDTAPFTRRFVEFLDLDRRSLADQPVSSR